MSDRLADMVETLKRIAEATHFSTNSRTPGEMASWTHAVAAECLSRISEAEGKWTVIYIPDSGHDPRPILRHVTARDEAEALVLAVTEGAEVWEGKIYSPDLLSDIEDAQVILITSGHVGKAGDYGKDTEAAALSKSAVVGSFARMVAEEPARFTEEIPE